MIDKELLEQIHSRLEEDYQVTIKVKDTEQGFKSSIKFRNERLELANNGTTLQSFINGDLVEETEAKSKEECIALYSIFMTQLCSMIDDLRKKTS